MEQPVQDDENYWSGLLYECIVKENNKDDA